jgi:hypothetical protein
MVAEDAMTSITNNSDHLPLEAGQGDLRGEQSPAAEWDRHVARHALDELFSIARQYRSSKSYRELIGDNPPGR